MSQQPCRLTPENVVLGKRSFAEYSTQAPLEVISDWIRRESECLDSGDENDAEDYRLSDSRSRQMDTPIEELVAAGGDLEHIMSMICELSDELHPLFHENNICACRHENTKFCCDPTYASVLELTKGTPGYLEYNWAPPLENIVLRAMMQLATRIITDKDTLPFWAGIIKASKGPDSEKHHFHVAARRSNTPENALLEKEMLDHLMKVAGNVRFHFKAFQDLGHRIEYHCEKDEQGIMFATWFPDVEDPELRLAELATRIFFEADVEKPSFGMDQLEAILEPKDTEEPTEDEESTSDSEQDGVLTFCGWRDGKPMTQDTPYPHVFMNLNHMYGYDMSNDDWQKLTISQLRSAILSNTATLCHEFAHAMVATYLSLQAEPHMNTESVAECGCAFTNFVFGGNVDLAKDAGAPGGVMLKPWPNYEFWKVYAGYGDTLDLSDFSGKALPAPVYHYPGEYKWECFFEQSFWEETKPRFGAIRKLWLRVNNPYHTDSTIAADETPEAPPRGTRVRLTPEELEYQRFLAKRDKRREAMEANKARWDRYCDQAEDRKEEFVDNGGLRVSDEAWAWCTKHFDERVFL
jgi:hypothetical protein